MPTSTDKRWWVRQTKGLGSCSWICLETCAFVHSLVCQQRLQWMHRRWWQTTVASPQTLSSSIICGHLHLCKRTLQTTPLYQHCWRGKTPRHFTSRSGCTSITFWIDQSCGKMIVVSFCYLSNRDSSFIFPPRSNSRTGRREILGGIVCCWLMEPTFRLQRAIPSPFGVTSSNKAGCGMRWGCPSKRATSAGGAGCMPQDNGTTSQSSGSCWSQWWSQGKGARWIGAIKAPLQPTWNAPVLWRPIQTPLKYSSGFGAGRRLWTSASKIGHSVNHVPSQLVGAPNSFWCYCHSLPAFFCG